MLQYGFFYFVMFECLMITEEVNVSCFLPYHFFNTYITYNYLLTFKYCLIKFIIRDVLSDINGQV